MFYFYVLKSQKDGNLYHGYSSNLKERFDSHNKGKVDSTKNRCPFKLIYYETYSSEKDAREREKQIKRRASAYTSLKRRIKRSLNDFE